MMLRMYPYSAATYIMPGGNKKSLDPSAVTVHPSGVEKALHEHIPQLNGWCGDKQGKKVSGLGGSCVIYTDWFKHMAGEF
ncbi:hypothetical protein SLEP1_g54253 [Rubroshorea leprosula]|uniref:Uncharacterized protein n=1 Tax=Rubroshorea leprosula TaxID=152421 RepID=A0AAV5MFH2_9ROSI|nr:hypothetical protein SLEP1_g54253 [Rubroshorea leprosula]